MKNALVTLVCCFALLSGCASQQHYNKAFSAETAIAGNARIIQAPPQKVFQLAKRTLVTQGFNIESADFQGGTIKATRILHDNDDSDISYNIHLTTDISEETPQAASVSVSASQQTVLHRKTYTWWKLLWIVPLFPIGSDYQTVVTKEGNVTEKQFYRDFFEALLKNLDAEKEKVTQK